MRTPGQDALAEAARLEAARVYGRTCPEHRQPEAAISEPRLFARAEDSYYGPAPTAVVHELVEALDTDAPRERTARISTADRQRVEQAIARGTGDEAIAADLALDLATVQRIHARLDRLSA